MRLVLLSVAEGTVSPNLIHIGLTAEGSKQTNRRINNKIDRSAIFVKLARRVSNLYIAQMAPCVCK